ncbi:MAG TPA: TA system VapC family ribonuclease toxin [Thermoanaerobaculia bacterium]|nr:TA system VapC family ribonuclease toxin [Thermoanaerobaculia bacterium]
MFVVDTNVLLYAADEDAEAHGDCRARLEEWRRQASPWFLTWGICYEFLRVSTHPRVFRQPWTAVAARGFLDALLAAPGVALLGPTERHLRVLRESLEELPDLRGNLMHDLHTAVVMREHGVSRIVTRDADFYRFPFLTVIDPLR